MRRTRSKQQPNAWRPPISHSLISPSSGLFSRNNHHNSQNIYLSHGERRSFPSIPLPFSYHSPKTKIPRLSTPSCHATGFNGLWFSYGKGIGGQSGVWLKEGNLSCAFLLYCVSVCMCVLYCLGFYFHWLMVALFLLTLQ